MKRATIADLSREAGVSVATVDRVLNGRLKVREETARKVHEAARRIGYHGANAIYNRILADLPELHFGIILQKGGHAFYRTFAAEIEDQLRAHAGHRLRSTIRYAESTRPGELAQLIASMAGKVDVVAATGLDHDEVTRAVADLRARGIPTFSLLSDFAQGVRESYVGLNNLKVGRAVGWLMAGIARRPGKVAVFVAGHRYHGHELREPPAERPSRVFARPGAPRRAAESRGARRDLRDDPRPPREASRPYRHSLRRGRDGGGDRRLAGIGPGPRGDAVRQEPPTSCARLSRTERSRSSWARPYAAFAPTSFPSWCMPSETARPRPRVNGSCRSNSGPRSCSTPEMMQFYHRTTATLLQEC